MQINRLFEIVYLLLHRKQMTTRELAAHFEVSSRTILRDVETLSAAGVPVYTSRGRGGGVSLMEHFVLNKLTLTQGEQEQILLALENLAVTESTGAAKTLAKLRTFFAREEEPWIEVDFSQWGGDGMDQPKFELLQRALVEQEGLAFYYYNTAGRGGQRRVYPYKLLFKSKAWYLYAYCLDKEDYRLFKVNRMRQLVSTGAYFDRSALPPAPQDGEGRGIAIPSAVQGCLQLRFHPSVAYRLYDEFDAERIVAGEGGYYHLTMTVPMDDWVLGFLLSFGDKVEVLSPSFFRERLREQVRRIAAIYAEGT